MDGDDRYIDDIGDNRLLIKPTSTTQHHAPPNTIQTRLYPAAQQHYVVNAQY